MLSVVYAECHIKALSITKLRVIYAECLLYSVLQ
jgi:hypothetical protein